MRETDRKLASPPAVVAPPRRSDSARGTLERSGPVEVFPRISPGERAPGAERPDADESAAEGAGVAGGGVTRGLFVSYPGLGIAAGIVIVALVLVAVISYRSGATDERNQLLAARNQAPPADTGVPSLVDTGGDPGRATPPGEPQGPAENSDSASGQRPAPATSLPVLGEDPRVRGSNYLIVATLFLNDAKAAAQFLTDTGVPCVVVAPEGKSPDALAQDRRANWIVIARECLTSDEYRLPTSSARRSDLERRVKALGRRWKQDQRGATDFSDCYWDKYGK